MARGSVVASWLLDLTAIALFQEPDLAKFSGRVSDSGEGRWTILAAIEESAPAPVLGADLYQRLPDPAEERFRRQAALSDAFPVRRTRGAEIGRVIGTVRAMNSLRKYTAVLCLALGTSACFVRRRVIARPPGVAENRPLLTATKDQLIDRIHTDFDPIRNFSMRADMSPSVGSVYTGTLTDYATIRAYVLFTRPDDIRVIGLDPVVHSTTIFDMASVGNDFRVSIPSKNPFIEGDNSAPPDSKNKLANLRPEAFLRSDRRTAPAPDDLTALEDDTDETKAVYIPDVREEEGKLQLVRSVFFDRYYAAYLASKDVQCRRNHGQRDALLRLEAVRLDFLSRHHPDPPPA